MMDERTRWRLESLSRQLLQLGDDVSRALCGDFGGVENLRQYVDTYWRCLVVGGADEIGVLLDLAEEAQRAAVTTSRPASRDAREGQVE